MTKISLQRKATFISSSVAFILMLLKLFVGIFSGSIAVLSSAIDSLLDFFVSVFNNFAVFLSEEKPTRKYNYWKWKIEAIASVFEWIIITASGLFIYYEAIKKIVFREDISMIWASLIVMVISVILTSLLVWFQTYVVKKTDNLVIKSDMLHYKTDLFSNLGILFWLLVIKFSWLYIIDAIIGIVIAFYIIITAWGLIKTWFWMLMDISLPKDEVKQIRKILDKNKKIDWYHWLRTRQSWEIKYVDVDLEMNWEFSLQKAHDISADIIEDIKNIDDRYTWKVKTHMDVEHD